MFGLDDEELMLVGIGVIITILFAAWLSS